MALPAGARAHSGPPAVWELTFDESDPDHLVAGLSFGMAVSWDGGEHWEWVCPSAYGGRSPDDTWVVLGADGRVYAGGNDTVARGDALACEFDAIDTLGVAEPAVHDFERLGTEVFLASGPDGAPNALYVDRDGTWTPVIGPTPKVSIHTIRRAPSDPMRIYVAEYGPTDGTLPRFGRVHRSDDGGMTWEPHEVPFGEFDREVAIVGVDPADADRILVRMRSPVGMERIQLSENGGVDWMPVLELEYIDAGVWGTDGVYVGGALDGLWRSEDGVVWEQVRTVLNPLCMVARGEELWVCGNDWIDGFALGRSVDDGRTFEPMLRLRGLTEIAECPMGSDVGTTCEDEYFELETVWATSPPYDAGPPEIDAGPGDVDAGVAVDAGERDAGGRRRDAGGPAPRLVPKGGGLCNVGTSHGPWGYVTSVLVVAGLAVIRARARRTRGCRRAARR